MDSHWSKDLPPTLTVISRQEREIKIMEMNSWGEHNMSCGSGQEESPDMPLPLIPIPLKAGSCQKVERKRKSRGKCVLHPTVMVHGDLLSQPVWQDLQAPTEQGHGYSHCKGLCCSCRTTDGQDLPLPSALEITGVTLARSSILFTVCCSHYPSIVLILKQLLYYSCVNLSAFRSVIAVTMKSWSQGRRPGDLRTWAQSSPTGADSCGNVSPSTFLSNLKPLAAMKLAITVCIGQLFEDTISNYH